MIGVRGYVIIPLLLYYPSPVIHNRLARRKNTRKKAPGKRKNDFITG